MKLEVTFSVDYLSRYWRLAVTREEVNHVIGKNWFFYGGRFCQIEKFQQDFSDEPLLIWCSQKRQTPHLYLVKETAAWDFWITVGFLNFLNGFILHKEDYCDIKILKFCTSCRFNIPDLSSGVLEVNAFETTIRKSGESREDVLLFKW